MLPYTTLITFDKAAGTSVYLQISTSLVRNIRSGLLQPGTRLPGTRELARQLGVHRKTVIAAYNDLYAQNWITVAPRKGFTVAGSLPELKPQPWKRPVKELHQASMPVPFNSVINSGVLTYEPGKTPPRLVIDDGFPDPRLAPLPLLLREYRSRLANQYAPRQASGTLAAGSIALREALSGYLYNTRGIRTGLPGVLVTHGAQMSIFLAASLLVKPGDLVVVGEPGYPVASYSFAQLGAKILKVPVDEHGMDTDALAEACRNARPKLVYVIPHHHHPTTVTLSPQRRMHLLELAATCNFAIIEDDYDYDFHYTSSPYLPLASSDHGGRVVYIGSFAKSLAASVRIGFMVAAPDFVEQASRLRRMIELRGDTLMEDALATLITNGDLGRYLRKANKICRERRDHLCGLLDSRLKEVVSYEKPAGGMAVWLRFQPAFPLKTIAGIAATRGLHMSSGALFDTPRHQYNAMRFGFASLSPWETEDAINIITSAVQSLPLSP
ncbi:PLP-dependent aminotransferase family protein [Hufsiella ginkgonis]|uniref:Aminotransferase class I/II-fold pyridoxal phosphate-dependent enzyme n=1 Tax=Hufsiella ginkgonis TaxID=2695274 RepID=A0A7K1XVG6_9SPHI|nr:PLP-dependent aminotransferase family protein [Hufsiella ginkgonis]MXV14759.1 aminotransferase class I/II-fold pyridoxal phosphate-dependent enzyme [Hufsiella ginkgonis]